MNDNSKCKIGISIKNNIIDTPINAETMTYIPAIYRSKSVLVLTAYILNPIVTTIVKIKALRTVLTE